MYFADAFYDGQFARTLYKAYAGAADLGEAFATARRIGPKAADAGRWHDGWRAMAESVAASAESRDRVGARDSYLRASEYYRQAYFFLRGELDDPRVHDAYERHVETFAAAVAMMDHPAAAVRIPYEGTTLHGFLYAPPGDATPRGTVLMPCGYDSTAEEGWAFVPDALARGFRVLVFEGPGQGEALMVRHLTFRPDFENVLTPVIDWLEAQPDDPGPLILFGRSFAGYLAPRAATREHRLAALVCDPAQPDMGAHLPKGVAGKVAGPAVSTMMRLSRNRAEFFRSRMATHGITDPGAYFAEIRTFTMLDDAGLITCPTLLVESEHDPVGGGGPVLYDALTCPKELVRLTAAQGVDGHCGGLGQQVWADTVYGWLDRQLAARPVAA